MMNSVIITLMVMILIILINIVFSLNYLYEFIQKRKIRYLAIGIFFLSLAISIILGIFYVMSIGFT